MKDRYGKMMKIVYTNDFKEWLDRWKGFVSSSEIYNIDALPANCEVELCALLKFHKIGYSWKTPLMNSLFSKSLDLPLDDGIHIEVGGKVLTESSLTAKFLEIEEDKKLEGVGIVITKNLSPHELGDFISRYQVLLDGLYKHLGLPNSVKEGYDVNITNTIVMLRDKKKMKFREIATTLYDAYSSLGMSEQFLEKFNENYIQKVYSDFKKTLTHKKSDKK